jgi:phage-related minor tail protein
MPDKTLFGEELGREIGDLEVELGRIEDLAGSVGSTVADTLRRAILDGRSLNNLLADVSRRFADIALKAALKPIDLAISSAIGSLFSSLSPSLGSVTAFAQGGVINRPTYFPLGLGGTGLAGEAGPEAILPLSRGPDGRLGVAASGGAPISVQMTINAADAGSFIKAEAEVSAMLLRAVRRGARAS